MIFMEKTSNKRVFITGGAGFIGSNMVNLLAGKCETITVYDNLSSGKYEFIKAHESKKGFSFVEADLLETDKLQEAMNESKPDVVIHFAANPDVALGRKITDLDLKQGTIATYNVLEAGRKNDVKDILFSSSSVVYGKATMLPTPEDYGPLLPISLYGSSKLASEGLITAFSHLYGMNYHIFRFANIVGKNSTHGVVLDFLKKLRKNPNELEVFGDGKQKKSYMDVKDCVKAMMHIYNTSKEKDNLYNLATDDQIDVAEIARIVLGKFGKNAKIRYTGGEQGWPGDVPNAFLSNAKLKKTGFKPKFNTSRDAITNFVNGLS